MSEQKPWEMNWSQPTQTQPNNANKKPWEMDWGKQEPQKEQDGALTRGWTKAKNSMAISADLATGNTASAAQKVKEADDYSKANPGSKEGKVLMDAWDRGDGITGGISEVVGQIKKNAEKSDGVIGGVRSVGKDLQAMGSGLLEQTPNMIAPMTGMAAGAKAGSMAGGAIGAAFGGVGAAPGAAIGGVVGSVAGGAAGNTAIEGGYHLLDSVQKAGINPQDTKAVQAFIEKNGDKVFDEAATKGLILGAVDAATWRMGRFFLDAPAKAATSRALTEMGVDAADKAAVKTAMQSNDFAQRIAADTAYQTSLKGAENVARNTAAFATEPAGEFAGEYFGSGIGYGDWDTKNAALEAMSSLGQSGVMYGGQKAFQYLTKPKSAVNAEQQAANTQGEQAKETQAIRDVQSQLFGGDVPNPFLDPSKLNPFSDNAPPASPIIDMARLEPADGNPRYDNGINFQAPNIETPLSLVEQQQTQADNGIDFERPEQGPTDLERQIQFNNTFGLETPNPVVDYNSISPFDSNPQQPVIDLAKVDPTPSQRLGINPNDGPLSAAAAFAVDTGVSSNMQQAAAQGENNNSPLTTAEGLLNGPEQNTESNQQGVTGPDSSNQSGLGESNTNTTGNDATARQGNALELNAPTSAVNGDISNNSTNLEPSGNKTGISQPGTSDGRNAQTGGSSGTADSGNREAKTEASRQQNLHNLDTIGNQYTVSDVSGTTELQENTGTNGTGQSDSQDRTVGVNDEATLRVFKSNRMGVGVVSDTGEFQDQSQTGASADMAAQNVAQPILGDIQSKVFELEAQLATEKSIPKKAQLRKLLENLNAERTAIAENNELATVQGLTEIQTGDSNIQTNSNQSKVSELEAQLAVEKSVPKKEQLRKQIESLNESLKPDTPSIPIKGGVADTEAFSNAAKTHTSTSQGSNSLNVVDMLAASIRDIDSTLTKRFPQSTFRDTESTSNFSATNALRNQIQSLLNIPSEGSSSLGVHTLVTEAARNGVATDTKLFGDASHAKSIRAHGFDSLDVESKAMVQRHMVTAMQDREVFRSVIKFLPIDVMNMLMGEKLSSDQALSNQSMFLDRLSIPFDNSVVIGRFADSVASSHPVALAALVAEKIGSPSNSPITSLKGLGAVGTQDSGHDDNSSSNKNNHRTGGVDSEYKKQSTLSPVDTLNEQDIQAAYGDSLESVMSDVEMLADDFTVDLRSVVKKQNALKNPNYHAVQHKDGRVEVLGMKHPSTGEWVGKASTQVEKKTNNPEKPDSSPETLSSNTFSLIRSDLGLAHSIPRKLMDQVHKLGDVVSDLASMKTEGVKTNVLYGKQLLAKIAKLNPDVNVHIVSDLNSIKDNAIRANLNAGGYFVPEQNTSYLYPQSNAWESSVVELVNHELVHSLTEQSITNGLVSQDVISQLDNFINIIDDYRMVSYENLSEHVRDRLDYAVTTNPHHEIISVGIAESEVRQALKNIIGDNGLQQLDGIFTEISTKKEKQNEQRKPSENSRDNSSGNNKNVSKPTDGITEEIRKGSATTKTDRSIERNTKNKSGNLSGNESSQNIIEGRNLKSESTEEKKQNSKQDKKRFSRAENRTASSTVAQVREALVSHFGEKTIADLEAQGILNIVQAQQEGMTGNVEGWYENGKVTLVASNLDADSAIATFLHELGGHGGFQNLMNKDAYVDLMRQFERMVEQGNPVAVEAKRLAERELNREVQLDEYLPYMITLASQMQLKNVAQKVAIKRFMDRVVSAVKAWLYDKGIKLNLNEKDVLALAERMVAAQSSVASNNEDSSSVQNDDIRFSRSSNYSDITNRIMNGFKSLPKVADNKGKDWLKIGLQALTRRQLTEIYSKILPPLNKYNDLAAQMDADKNDAGAEADNIVREWSKLKDENQLAGLMHDATLAKIDPAKPHVAGDSIIKYQQLRNDFNTLSPEAQAMYIKARDAYKKHYANIHQAIKERILRSELSSQKKADLLKKMDDNFFNGYIKGVYFPLARFGEYVIVVRNKNNQVESVSRAETMGEAESVRSELMKKYPLFIVDPIKLDKEFNASRDSVGRGFMSSLFDEVDNLGLAAKEQAEFEDTLSQLYLSSMPDISWAKHGIHRKGTAGFSHDARRAFAQNMFSGANYLAKLRYGDQLVEQLDKMQKHADEQFKNDVHYDQRSAQRVIGEMNKRHDNLMNPQGNPLSSFLTSVGFMYYMGLSPAAAMVNLSQTALIAYPLMGAKWNYNKAGKELLKASRDFAKGVEFNVPDFSSLENFKNSIGDVYSPNIDKVIKGLELDAYNQAVSRGVIDVTQAHDLAGIAQGEDSKVMWYFRPAMRLASGLFHHAERFNREVTFIAAYRLATKAGASHTEAFDQAMDMVYRGHFDYSAGNRARFMQSNIAKVVLLFKQYAQNMLYTLLRNAHQSIYALDPKDQREARRALAGILGMHALAAGAIGLPITGMLATASILIAKKSKLGAAAFGIAAMAALASGGGDDDPYELENVIRNWLADIHPMFADLVFGGVPRAFSPVDLSGRVGLNNLIIPDVQDGLEGADWAKAMQSALLGPVVGISTNLVKGFQEINDGDYGRGIETMLPVVLKNAMKSVRFGREGVLTKNNDVIQDEVGGVGLFSQAIGFSPSDVRTSMEGRSAIYQYKTRLENHRKELMHKWVIAKRDDDSEGMEKAWAEIQEFNEKVSEKNPRMRINRINLMQSYKTNERRAKETGDGGVYLTKRQKGAEEQGRFAFGE